MGECEHLFSSTLLVDWKKVAEALFSKPCTVPGGKTRGSCRLSRHVAIAHAAATFNVHAAAR
jgi:hypothetical protein